MIEVQVREELYGTANQPVCIGKKDERGNWLFPVKGALDPNDIAICIGERLLERVRNDELAARVARLKEAQRALAETETTSRCASRISARAARTIPRPWCRRAAAPMPASAATTWRSGWTARTSGLHPDGRRGRQLDRRGAVLKARPRVPEPRRRHLQSFGLARGARRHPGRRQHHLQDPVQRRRRHDRRPAQ